MKKSIFILLVLLCALMSYSQKEEPIEHTRDMYIDEINRQDSIIEAQADQIAVLQLSVLNSTAFCEGWNDGYEAGICYKIFGCIPAIPPQCPMPDINESSYKDGYNRGFIKGKEDQ